MDKIHAEQDIACVILAAGFGRRFGEAKMLHIMPNGQSMIEQSIEQYAPVFSDIYVVVREQDEDIKACIQAYSSKMTSSKSRTANTLNIVECNDATKGRKI